MNTQKVLFFFKLKARTDNSSVFSIDICANNGILKKYDGTLSHSNLGLDFHTYCDSDLDLWPSDPTLGVIYYPRPMHMWSIKPIGQSVHKLLIGNELVYRQTHRATDIQQNNINLFFEGGHNKCKIIIRLLWRSGYGVRLETGSSRVRSPLWTCSLDLPNRH